MDRTPATSSSPVPAEIHRRDPVAIRPDWRLTLVVLLLAALADVTIYRGEGLAGVGVLLGTAPLLMCLAALNIKSGNGTALLLAMLVLLGAKLVWCGATLEVAVGFLLLTAFAATLAGQRPYVLETLAFAAQIVPASFAGVGRHWETIRAGLPRLRTTAWSSIVLPVIACAVFGMLFILANPDLMAAFDERAELLFRSLRAWLIAYGPRMTEVLFWFAVIWIATGALRPVVRASDGQRLFGPDHTESPDEQTSAAWYPAYRNTLVAVSVLFAVYLVFELRTLWFREFPPGFHYSGYAHEGAFWLTVTLALSTVMLSAIFRGGVLHDYRLPKLRRLAWIWSVENLLLAVAVYHRMWIYVGFNGMTRLRVVGFLGITAVVAGFALVVLKIARRHDFVWLIRRQLWALAACVYLYAVLPVDLLVMQYNVSRILAGDPAPSVQLTVQPIDSQGYLALPPLLAAENAVIREGVRAMLARQRPAQTSQTRHWTAFQGADALLEQELRELGDRLEFASGREREEALHSLRTYAYQWY